MTDVADFLEHHGVLGMKWGVRKNNDRNPNYDSNQRERDRQIYGRRGVNRVNKALNSGRSISVARGAEKTKRDRVLGRNKYVRVGGKIVGTLAGLALAKFGRDYAQKLIRQKTGVNVDFLDNPAAQAAIYGGAFFVGQLLGGDTAVAINTRAHGYDPSRKA